jgi:hypothetical protein
MSAGDGCIQARGLSTCPRQDEQQGGAQDCHQAMKLEAGIMNIIAAFVMFVAVCVNFVTFFTRSVRRILCLV